MKSLLRKIRHQRIVKHLAISEGDDILDTSCQDGSFLSVLANNNPDKHLTCYGIDINASDITRAKQLLPHANFQKVDNSKLPFADNTFDVVISSLTLHHMHQPIDSLMEMRRVLKDTGSMYLIDIIAEGKIFDSILKNLTCPEPYHFEKFYSLAECKELLTKTKISIHTTKKVLIFPTFTLLTPVLILELKKEK